MARDDVAYVEGAEAVDGTPPTDESRSDGAVLVEALAIAWTAATLYDDPRGNEAFQRAVDVLRAAPRHPLTVGVGPGSFRDETGPITSRREAAAKLAGRLFSHKVAEVTVVSPPSADDLLQLLQIIDADTLDAEDIPTALSEAGVRSITLSHQSILMPPEDLELPEAEPDADPAWVVREQIGPEAFVAWLLSQGDIDEIARLFLEEYAETIGLVEEDDHWGREDVVHAFVDAFFHLPSDHQGRLFSEFLTHRDRPECLLFLDQFGGHELGTIAAHLDDDAHPLLLDYARIAAEQGTAGRGGEIAEMLDPRGFNPQLVVMERIANVLASDPALGDEAAPVERLRDRLPSRRDHKRAGINVVRGLLAVTDDDASFHRLARTWADLVARAVRDADAKTAGAWIRAAADAHSEERSRTLYRMLSTHLDRDLLEQLVLILLDPSPAAEAVRRAAPGFAVDGLVKRLGEEEDRSRRRLLIDALSAVAAVDSVPFVKHLVDDRWFLVRNIVVILGRGGRTEVAEAVRPALRHEEPRVRREALRTVFALAGDDSVPELIAALEDDSNSVRRQALFLLRTPPDPAVDDALARYIKTDIPIGERLKIMEVLAARGTESARAVLRRYASIQLGLTSTSRTLRAAARRALGRNS